MNLRRILKSRTTRGVRNALRTLWNEYAMQRAHRSSLVRLKRSLVRSTVRLHIGCGPKTKAGWTNIDLFSSSADLHLDMREELPFPDECASIVYSEHFLEHLEYPDEVLRFLAECFRVLIAGGTFSVGVPDTERALTAYVNREGEYFRLTREAWHPAWCATPMHQLNFLFRQGREHKYAYDFETLAQILGGVGFIGVEARPFRPGLDSADRKVGTLYVDARKPVERPATSEIPNPATSSGDDPERSPEVQRPVAPPPPPALGDRA